MTCLISIILFFCLKIFIISTLYIVFVYPVNAFFFSSLIFLSVTLKKKLIMEVFRARVPEAECPCLNPTLLPTNCMIWPRNTVSLCFSFLFSEMLIVILPNFLGGCKIQWVKSYNVFRKKSPADSSKCSTRQLFLFPPSVPPALFTQKKMLSNNSFIPYLPPTQT